MWRKRAASCIVVLLVLVGCSPVARLRCRFDLPKGVTADPSRLHLRANAACPHHGGETDPPKPLPPEPGLEEPDDFLGNPSADASTDASADASAERSRRDTALPTHDGFDGQLSVRASSCWVAMTAFYDANGNGVVDDGDLVGELPATFIVDRGLCMGNLTTAGPVPLRPLLQRKR